MDLTETEKEWLAHKRSKPCRHGHAREDARVYRNRHGLYLDCRQCSRKRVNAYHRRMNRLASQWR